MTHLSQPSVACVVSMVDISVADVSMANTEAVETEKDEEVWKLYSPASIDRALCRARIWNAGLGGQCTRAPMPGTELCSSHKGNKWRTHGLADGPIPWKKLSEFQAVSARTRPAPKILLEHVIEPSGETAMAKDDIVGSSEVLGTVERTEIASVENQHRKRSRRKADVATPVASEEPAPIWPGLVTLSGGDGEDEGEEGRMTRKKTQLVPQVEAKNHVSEALPGSLRDFTKQKSKSNVSEAWPGSLADFIKQRQEQKSAEKQVGKSRRRRCTCGCPTHLEKCQLFNGASHSKPVDDIRTRAFEDFKLQVPAHLSIWSRKQVEDIASYIDTLPKGQRKVVWKKKMREYHPDKRQVGRTFAERTDDEVTEVFLELKRRYDLF